MWIFHRIAWLSAFVVNIISFTGSKEDDQIYHPSIQRGEEQYDNSPHYELNIDYQEGSNPSMEGLSSSSSSSSISSALSAVKRRALSISAISNRERRVESYEFGMSPTDYPNPVHEPKLCGIESLLGNKEEDNTLMINDKERPLYLCDPSKILNNTNLHQIQFALNNFTNFVNYEHDTLSKSILRCENDQIGYTPRKMRGTKRSLKGIGARRRVLQSRAYQWDRIEESIKDAYKWKRREETSSVQVNAKKHGQIKRVLSRSITEYPMEQHAKNKISPGGRKIPIISDRVIRRRNDMNFWSNLMKYRDSEDRYLELIGGEESTDDGYVFDFYKDDDGNKDDDYKPSKFHTYEDGSNDPNQIRIAVAIVEKINLRAILHALSYYTYEDEDDMVNDAAQYFAEYLYDSWKLGYNNGSHTSCGPTGILIFLSIKDRVCFISTGRKVNSILPWWRLEGVITGIKPELRNENYEKAILNAIDELGRLISLGPPTISDRIHDFLERFGVVIMFAMFTFFFAVWGEYRDRWNRWRLTETMSRLSQKEKSEARSLQREYHCTSCPICLESFEHKKPEKRKRWRCAGHTIMHHSSSDDGVDNLVGSDDLPLKLLRCGHVFCETCWKIWVSSGQGNPYACPVCRQDVGGMLFRSTFVYSENRDNSNNNRQGTTVIGEQSGSIPNVYGTFEGAASGQTSSQP